MSLSSIRPLPPHEGRQQINAVHQALQLSSHVLVLSPHQLANQLRGRLHPRVTALLHGASLSPQTELRLDSHTLTPVSSSLMRTISAHRDRLTACTISPDERLILSCSADGEAGGNYRIES